MPRANNPDLAAGELAMRCALTVQANLRPERIIKDYAELLVDRFGISIASGFRLARLALDCIGVEPAKSHKRDGATHRYAKPTYTQARHGAGMLM